MEITATAFKEFLKEKKLMASKCSGCGAIWLPPRPICLKCYGKDMEWMEMRGKGKIITFTVIYVGPQPMTEAGYSRDNPYCTAIVELEEGLRISAQIIGVDATRPESIQVGAPVTAEFVERAKWFWGGELGKIQEAHLAFRVCDYSVSGTREMGGKA
jgi:hypothetical protein